MSSQPSKNPITLEINKTYQPPLIVLGMHRSGTTLITKIITELGVFSGFRPSDLYEAAFFVNTNRWLLQQAGGAWDNPQPFAEMIEKEGIKQPLVQYMRFLAESPRSLQFLGFNRYLKYRSLFNINELWGWKDPRTTFTLPLWLELFPDAKLLHIYRNGIDVAASLEHRGKSTSATFSAQWRKPVNRVIYSLFWKSNPKMLNRRLGLERGFTLWEVYTRHIETLLATIPEERKFSIAYEDILMNGVRELQTIAEFIGLHLTSEQLEAIQDQFKPSRAHAFRKDDRLVEFYQQVKSSPQMIHYGYHNLL